MAKHISQVLRWYFTPVILAAGMGVKIVILFAAILVFLSFFKESLSFADQVPWLLRAGIGVSTILTGFYCLFDFMRLRLGNETQDPFPVTERQFEVFNSGNYAGTKVGGFFANLLSALWPTLFAWFVVIAGYLLFKMIMLFSIGGSPAGGIDLLLYNFSAMGLITSAWTIFLRVFILESGDTETKIKGHNT